MVLGFNEGGINITLAKTAYSPGDVVKGSITVNLKNSKFGKELRLDVYGEREDDQYQLKENRRYILRQMIAGEQMYCDGDVFPFSFKIPANIKRKKMNGVHLRPFKHYTGEKPSKWFVQASLDMPLTFDLNHRIGIKIKQ
jgi:hypothetical protein